MRMILRALLVCALLGWTSDAIAATVSVDTLNCHSRPDSAAAIVGKLSRGQHVSVKETRGGWSHVASPDSWVVARYLSVDQVGNIPAKSTAYRYPTRQSFRSPRHFISTSRYSIKRNSSSVSRHSRATLRRSGSTSGTFGGSCPCSGSNVCIGPRGGRYCITSGGNKRYGV